MYTSVEHDLCPTCYERPPVLSDRFWWAEGVVAQDRFYCNLFDVMRDLTRVGVDPVQAVVPPDILVNIPQPAPLNDVLYKLGYDTIDFAFMRMREDADDLWTAADVVAEVVFGLDFVRATHKWFGLGTALELYALWSVGYIDDPDVAFSDFDT